MYLYYDIMCWYYDIIMTQRSVVSEHSKPDLGSMSTHILVLYHYDTKISCTLKRLNQFMVV